jgi:polysaccharide deacetylase family protein (PEP-CTERM system associated)
VEPLQLESIPNMLSVDLEDWHGASCVPETNYLLELFSQARAKATFFVLRAVAEREPELIRRIDYEGHEVASHGGTHEQLFKKTPQIFFEELGQATDILSGITGKKVLGYRAPHFSIFEGTYWALDVLAELGIKYDSSIFPFAGPRYGVPDFPRYPVHIRLERGSIIEVPLSTVHHFRRNWPVSGGGYFRLLPYTLIRRAIREVNREHIPFVVYCHPYEFSASRLSYRDKVKELGWLKAKMKEIKFNLFRKSMRRKLSQSLEEFRFCSFREALGNEITK